MTVSSTETANTEPLGSASDQFLQLFTRTQRPLYLFLLSQTASVADAEDLLQETNLIILAKCRQYQEGTNFGTWARQIAQFELLRFRRKSRRDKLRFSDEFFDAVARESETREPDLEVRRRALEQCLKKLRDKDRELIQLRYHPNNSGKEVAEQIGRPQNAVYQSLMRIRRVLLECMQRQLVEGAQ